MTTELGRLLTEEECDWLRDRGFDGGYDVDTCKPQLNHITVVYSASDYTQTQALCKTPNLWGSGLIWGAPRASGDFVEEDRRLKCAACLSEFEALHARCTNRDYVRDRERWGHDAQFKTLVEVMREHGRPDLAMLLESIRVSYMVDAAVMESTMRHVFRNMLAIKSERIQRAMRLIEDSDGEH